MSEARSLCAAPTNASCLVHLLHMAIVSRHNFDLVVGACVESAIRHTMAPVMVGRGTWRERQGEEARRQKQGVRRSEEERGRGRKADDHLP